MKCAWSKLISTVLLMLGICLGEVSHGADSPEDVFWKSVRKSDVIEEYKLYVDQYPKGKYSGEAWRLIGRLEAEAEAKRITAEREKQEGPQVAPIQPMPTPSVRIQSAEEIEQELWDSVKNSRDSRDIDGYLSSYPNGRFALLGRQKLKNMTASAPPVNTVSPATVPAATPTTPSASRLNDGSTRHDIQIKAPDIAENGAVVPMDASFSPPLRAGDKVEVLVGNNVASILEVLDGEVSLWSLRVAMPQTLIVRVQSSGGGVAEKSIKVTVGVDNARLAADPRLLDLTSAKIRTRSGETRMLIAGAFARGKLTISGSGFRVAVSGSSYLAFNPVMGFQGSVRDGDNIQLSMIR